VLVSVSTAAPQFSQNFAPPESGVPHPVQNRAVSVRFVGTAREPHAEQNDWPSLIAAAHFAHLLIASPLN
jgi:hypothetical protein